MCGLLGIFAPNSFDEHQFRKARDVMTARGPDAAGFEHIEVDANLKVLLGHRRLSIQDLSDAGAQPMWSSSGRYAIVYNGEVYNAPALRASLEAKGHRFRSTSDTEVVLEAYAVWGASAVERFNGIFAFAIWDKKQQEFFVARDRIGIKPLYYTPNSDRFACASDARALRELGFGAKINRAAQALYLALGYVPAPASIWDGICKLEAGQYLHWRKGCMPRLTTYWSAPDDVDHSNSKISLENLIDEVVEEQLLSDVPVGLFLSGGLDSSVIAASIAALGRKGANVEALTVAFPDNPLGNEAPVAERTAKALGLRCRTLELSQSSQTYFDAAVDSLDEPLAFNAIVTQVAISQLAAENGLKVVLSGDGGDEVFGGYRWYAQSLKEIVDQAQHLAKPATVKERIVPRHRARWKGASSTARFMARDPLFAHAQSVFAGLLPEQIAHLMPDLQAEAITEELHAVLSRHSAPRLPEKRRRQRIDLYTFCQDVVLTKVDRAGMAFGVESRPPLLDHRIIEWGLSRPVAPENDEYPKNVLREIVCARGLEHLLSEPKRGFSLKSKDRPKSNPKRALVLEKASKLGISGDWQTHLPIKGKKTGMRLDILYWLALWHSKVEDIA